MRKITVTRWDQMRWRWLAETSIKPQFVLDWKDGWNAECVQWNPADHARDGGYQGA